MKQSQHIVLVNKLLQTINAAQSDYSDRRILQAPLDAYCSDKIAQLEYETLFRQHPMLCGLSSLLPQKNSFATMDVANVPLLLTRDDEGIFHAFINSCRHRGVKVVSEESGAGETFVCPYHAWSYSNRGELKAVAHCERFGEIDKTCRGLIELPAVESCHMLWVQLDRQQEFDIEATLSELVPELNDWQFCDYHSMGSFDLPVAANWKLVVDTFGESYHFGQLHKETLATILMPHAMDFEFFDNNFRLLYPHVALNNAKDFPEAEWKVHKVATLVYYIFPNIYIVINNEVMNIFRTYPGPKNTSQSMVNVSVYFHETHAEKLKKQPEHTTIDPQHNFDIKKRAHKAATFESTKSLIVDSVGEEDFAMAESAQRMIDTGTLDCILFGQNELLLQRLNNNFRKAINLPPLEEYSSSKNEP